MSKFTRTEFVCDNCQGDLTDKLRIQFGQCDFCDACCNMLSLKQADLVASATRDKRRREEMGRQMQNQQGGAFGQSLLDPFK